MCRVKLGVEWWRDWDSNPRYGFPYSGFQEDSALCPIELIQWLTVHLNTTARRAMPVVSGLVRRSVRRAISERPQLRG
jgi:hypothetical protein